MPGEIGGREEVLVVSMTAGHERSAVDDGLPEEARGAVVSLVSGQRSNPLETDGFRNLRVGMQSVERISSLGERRDPRG